MSRSSKPYVESSPGVTNVRAGERVERDDGWWRAMRVSVKEVPLGRYRNGVYVSEVEWHPVEPVTHEFVCATTDESLGALERRKNG